MQPRNRFRSALRALASLLGRKAHEPLPIPMGMDDFAARVEEAKRKELEKDRQHPLWNLHVARCARMRQGKPPEDG